MAIIRFPARSYLGGIARSSVRLPHVKLPGRFQRVAARMSGNTLGTLFCVTSFGESHGPAIGCVVDGCPPGMALGPEDIQKELDRRKPGTSRHVTQRRESDTVEILSGVYEGRTTGTAIGFLVRNEDQRSNVKVPACASSTIPRDRLRPCPDPRPTCFVVKNWSKI